MPAQDADARRIVGCPAFIDGRLYCPGTPGGLTQTVEPLPVWATRSDIAARQQRMEKRQPYEMGRHSGPDQQGYSRVMCPAEAGKVRCPLKQASMSQPKSLPLIAKPPAKSSAPTCCTQKTVTVPPTVAAKTRQKHSWGTGDWYRSYQRRNVVEGYFGNLKSEAREDAGRGRIRVMGLAKVALMLAAWTAACNLRLLDVWRHRQKDRDEELADDPFVVTPTKERRRAGRRQDTLAKLLGTPAA